MPESVQRSLHNLLATMFVGNIYSWNLAINPKHVIKQDEHEKETFGCINNCQLPPPSTSALLVRFARPRVKLVRLPQKKNFSAFPHVPRPRLRHRTHLTFACREGRDFFIFCYTFGQAFTRAAMFLREIKMQRFCYLVQHLGSCCRNQRVSTVGATRKRYTAIISYNMTSFVPAFSGKKKLSRQSSPIQVSHHNLCSK